MQTAYANAAVEHQTPEDSVRLLVENYMDLWNRHDIASSAPSLSAARAAPGENCSSIKAASSAAGCAIEVAPTNVPTTSRSRCSPAIASRAISVMPSV